MPIIAALHIPALGKLMLEFENKSIWAFASERERKKIRLCWAAVITGVHQQLWGFNKRRAFVPKHNCTPKPGQTGHEEGNSMGCGCAAELSRAQGYI